MKYTGKRLARVARKLGYVTVEGKKHIRVYNAEGQYIATLSRGIIKTGTLAAIIKQMGITKKRLNDLL